MPSTCSSIQFSSISSCSGLSPTAPSTPSPPARLTATATSRQWVKAKIGYSIPMMSHRAVCTAFAPPTGPRRAGIVKSASHRTACDPRAPGRRTMTTLAARGDPTMGDQKIETIQKIYDAFGQGDVQTILDALSDDLDFGSEVDSKIAPWHGLRRTKPEVVEFFQAIGENLEVTEFTLLSITSNDTDVMAVIRFGVKVPATGKSGA